MPKSNNLRLQWAWWLLAIALLLALQYWPRETARTAPPQVARSPTTSRAQVPVDVTAPSPAQPLPDERLPEFLPAEARTTIAMIQRGAPFPYRQDGSVFGNREGHLPRQPRGWYHEYTVQTPGLPHRGTRRIITGGNPPRIWYYTSDHYASFRVFEPGTTDGASR